MALYKNQILLGLICRGTTTLGQAIFVFFLSDDSVVFHVFSMLPSDDDGQPCAHGDLLPNLCKEATNQSDQPNKPNKLTKQLTQR